MFFKLYTLSSLNLSSYVMPSDPFIICHCGLINLEKKANEFFIVRKMNKYTLIKQEKGPASSSSFYISADELKQFFPWLWKKCWENSNQSSTNHINSGLQKWKCQIIWAQPLVPSVIQHSQWKRWGILHTCACLSTLSTHTCTCKCPYMNMCLLTISSTNRELLRFN